MTFKASLISSLLFSSTLLSSHLSSSLIFSSTLLYSAFSSSHLLSSPLLISYLLLYSPLLSSPLLPSAFFSSALLSSPLLPSASSSFCSVLPANQSVLPQRDFHTAVVLCRHGFRWLLWMWKLSKPSVCVFVSAERMFCLTNAQQRHSARSRRNDGQLHERTHRPSPSFKPYLTPTTNKRHKKNPSSARSILS